MNSFESYFPPPWDINKYSEKTEGWIEFQKAMKNDPDYYSLHSKLNIFESTKLDKQEEGF